MLILQRYVRREIGRPLFVVATVLVAVFFVSSVATSLANVASGLMESHTVALLALLRTLIALDVLLPLALYLTVILGLNRLAAQNELTAMYACGFPEGRIERSVLPLILVIALVVGVLSVAGRPKAYALIYQIRARAESGFDVADLRPGRFYELGEGDRVIYVDRTDPERTRLDGLLAWIDRGRSWLVISIDEADRRHDEVENRPVLEARGVRVYEVTREQGGLRFSLENVVTDLAFGELAQLEYKRKAAPTRALAASAHPEDVAELQWRTSRFSSTLLLGWLALRLGRARPRRRLLGRLVLPLVVFFAYFLATLALRNAVEDGLVPPWPGVFWVEAALALGLVGLGAAQRRRSLRPRNA